MMPPSAVNLVANLRIILTIVRPIALLLTLPITILTLGLESHSDLN